MGVDNLLTFVKNATTTTHISETSAPNSTVAVDISHWIYKACYACPEALYHKKNLHVVYNTIVSYIENYVNLLEFHHIKIMFVFDGLKLPAKHITHQERASKRNESRQMVEKLLASNNPTEARKYMLRCIEIKFDIVQRVIDYCRRKRIEFIIAPYEADAQLAFFNNNNISEFIITEDTDLILYGCKKIIYKLDTTGHCLLYERSRLSRCFGPHGVEFEKFRRMCILSGCDYLKNIPNVGLQSAKKFFLLTRQDNIRLLLPRLATYLKSPRLAGKVSEEYINGFINAESTFKHHIVYDTEKQRLRPLEPYPKGCSSSDFPQAGKRFHNILAAELVNGRINLDEIDPELDLDAGSDASDDEQNHTDDCEKLPRPIKV